MRERAHQFERPGHRFSQREWRELSAELKQLSAPEPRKFRLKSPRRIAARVEYYRQLFSKVF